MDGQRRMSESLRIASGIAFQERQVRVDSRFNPGCATGVAETCGGVVVNEARICGNVKPAPRQIAVFLCQGRLVCQIADIGGPPESGKGRGLQGRGRGFEPRGPRHTFSSCHSAIRIYPHGEAECYTTSNEYGQRHAPWVASVVRLHLPLHCEDT